MVGEWGAFNKTPHDVVLRWAEDCLSNWRKAGWGWAMWNFRGSFGVLDSGRGDVQYEDFEGHKLDRKLLDLLDLLTGVSARKATSCGAAQRSHSRGTVRFSRRSRRRGWANACFAAKMGLSPSAKGTGTFFGR